MKKTKKLSVMMIAVMLLSFSLICAACSVVAPKGEKVVSVNGFSISDKNIADGFSYGMSGDEGLISQNQTYREDDVVNVIITMGSGSLLENYLKSGFCGSVLEYLDSAEGQAAADEMMEKQNLVLENIRAFGFEFNLAQTLHSVINGFSISMRYGDVALLKEVEGIEDYTIAQTFSIPSTSSITSSGFASDLGHLSSNTGYNGEGMVIAVIDSGFDVNHEVFAEAPVSPAISLEFINSVMDSTYAAARLGRYMAEDFYVSAKIPFAFDYADGDSDVIPSERTYMSGLGLEHGTHVAGIAVGNCDLFKGAAYNAQLVAMKVSSDKNGSISLDTIVNALGDAIILGVDAVNISIGASCGPEYEILDSYEYMNKAYNLAERCGVSVSSSAGNDYSAAMVAGGNLTANPDSGLIGRPSSYLSVMTSASMDSGSTLYVANGGYDYQIYNAVISESIITYNFYDILGGKSQADFEYVFVPNYGAEADYADIDVKGKIAFVMRGEISFDEKVLAAEKAGAIACIIGNNADEKLIPSIGADRIPTAAVTHSVAEALFNAENKVLTVDNTKYLYTMSEFSSWGPTASLDIGIDLTAPGGDVYSSIPEAYAQLAGIKTPYAYMSGTSMSSPNQTAAVAIVKQYIREAYPELPDRAVQTMAYQLLMSTAMIVENEEGNPYSPRKQGAGLIDIDAAVNTDAYLTVTGSNATKLNLGSDVEKEGVYTLHFNLVNIGENALSYDVGALVFTETAGTYTNQDGVTKSVVLEKAKMFEGFDIKVKAVNGNVEDNVVTVAAGQTAKIKVVITLTDENKAYFEENFENGSYVEGFATLAAMDEGSEDLSIPFIAFYGDWDNVPMFEPTYAEIQIHGKEHLQMYPSILYTQKKITDGLLATTPLGDYPEIRQIADGYTKPGTTVDKTAIGPNQHLAMIIVSYLRNPQVAEYNFYDELGNTYYSQSAFVGMTKTYSPQGSGLISVAQIELSGFRVQDNVFANNQIINYEIKAYSDYENNVYQTLVYSVYVDVEAPTMENAVINTVDGRQILTMNVFDNHYLMDYTFYTDGEKGLEALLDGYVPVYSETYNGTNEITFDVTEMLKKVDGKLYVEFTDYADNNVIYEIQLDESSDSNSVNVVNDAEDDEIFTFMEGNTVYTFVDGEKVEIGTYNFSSTDNKDPFPPLFPPKDEVENTGEEFVIKDGTLHYYNGEGGEVVVPDEVKVIGSNVFKNNKKVTSVKLPETVTTIKSLAFYMCSYLKEINVPEALTEIGAEAFRGCRRLEAFDMSECKSLKTISDFAFNLCVAIKEMVIPASVTKIGQYAIYGLTSLEKLVINADVTLQTAIIILPSLKTLEVNGKISILNRNGSAGSDFNGLESVETIVFNGPQGKIGEDNGNTRSYSLSAMPKLREVIFKGDVEYIGGYSFSNCPNLEKVTLEGNLGGLGRGAFTGSTKLTSFTLGENNSSLVKDAETGVVYNNDKTKMFIPAHWAYEGIYTLPTTITTLSDYHFTHSEYQAKPATYNIVITDDTASIGLGVGRQNYTYDSQLGGVVLHSGITTIPAYCFYDCVNVNEDTLDYNGAAVTNVGNYAFANTGYVNLSFPETATVFGSYVWVNCKKLLSVTLPENWFRIGNYVFDGCTALKEVVIPSNIATVGTYMFRNCTSLERVEFSYKGIPTIGMYAFAGCGDVEIVGLDKITSISNYAFKDAGITSYKLPDTLRTIGTGAFYNCTQLETLTIPDGNLSSVSSRAFAGCESLKEIHIPAKLTSLNVASVFDGCVSLEKITVNEVNSAYASHEGVLYNKAKTKIILYPVAKPDAEYILPETVTYVEAYVFIGVTKLESLTLTNVTEIADYAFYQCSLKEVNAPVLKNIAFAAFAECANLNSFKFDNVESIEEFAFAYTALEEVTITSKMEYIGLNAFTGCQNLEKVEITGETIYFDFSNVFYQTGIKEVILSEENTQFVIFEDGLYDADKTVLFKYIGSEGTVVLPEGLLKVAHEAFIGNTDVKKVVFPASLKVIGGKAFYGCTSLETLEFKSEKAPMLQGYYEEGVRLPYANFVMAISEVGEGLDVELICPDNDSYRTFIWRTYFGL